MDLMGPLPPSGGFKYIWGGIDSFSRRVILRPMRGTTAEEMFEVLTDVFSTEGLWENVSVDAKCVSLKGIDKKLLDTLRVGVIRSYYTSRQQGTIERAFGTLLVKMLKLLDNEPTLKGWARVLPKLAFVFNSSPCRSLGYFSPNALTFHTPPSLVTPVLNIGMLEGRKHFAEMVRLTEIVRKSAFQAMVSNKKYYNAGETLTEGQIVFRRRMSFSVHNNKKLQKKVIQALKVIGKVGTSMFKLRDLMTEKVMILPLDQLISSKLTEIEAKELLIKLNE